MTEANFTFADLQVFGASDAPIPHNTAQHSLDHPHTTNPFRREEKRRACVGRSVAGRFSTMPLRFSIGGACLGLASTPSSHIVRSARGTAFAVPPTAVPASVVINICRAGEQLAFHAWRFVVRSSSGDRNRDNDASKFFMHRRGNPALTWASPTPPPRVWVVGGDRSGSTLPPCTPLTKSEHNVHTLGPSQEGYPPAIPPEPPPDLLWGEAERH